LRILDLNWTRWNPAVASTMVGWPKPETDSKPDCMYHLVQTMLPEFKAAGFTHLLLPPPCLGAGGTLSDGYDLKDNYTQDGTAFGDSADLHALIHTAHTKFGLAIGLDLTLHQYDGYPNQEYKTKNFPKDPTCFAAGMGQTSRPGNVQPDSVPDVTGDYPDGDLAAYGNSDSYMWTQTIIWAQWMVSVFGYDFIRIDEAKGLHAPFVKALLDSPILKNTFAFGEYFDGNPAALSGYVNYWMGRRVSVLDFMFKFNAQNVCNNNSSVWMGALANCGFCLQDSMKAVTFVESHDTDNSIGEQVIWNKLIGYFLLLTFPGAPMIYYRDWSDDPFCYNLKERINNLLYIHQHLVAGDFQTRLDTDHQVFAFERLGFGTTPGCVCIVNNDQYNEHTNTIKTRYPPGTRLHEYTGNGGYANDIWVDDNWCITVTTPKNINGLSYLVYGVYL
jgi:alpha-amylase